MCYGYRGALFRVHFVHPELQSANSKSTKRFDCHISVLICFFVDYFKRLGIVRVYILYKAFL